MHDDWTIVKELSEKGVSGFKVSSEKRDAIQSIKAYAAQGKLDVLLVYMFDRLGRKEDETPFVVEWFAKQGVEMWSVKEGRQSFETHVDKLTNYIRFWQASGESVKTALRVRTKHEQMTQEGIFRGGNVPYGYKLVPSERLNKKGYPLKDVVIDDTQAPAIRTIFEKYVYEGYGVHRLANYLNDTSTGKVWHPSSVNTVLRNPTYTGRFHFDDIRFEPIEHLRIIPDELFEQVEDIMRSRATREPVKHLGMAPLRTTGIYLLTGLLYCGDCGSRMIGSMSYKSYTSRTTGRTSRNERRIYRCYGKFITATECAGQSTFSADRIEEAVEQVVQRYLDSVRSTPRDEAYEKARREAEKEAKAKLEEARKRFAGLEKDVALLKDEVLRCLAGASAFDREELNAMLMEKRRLLADAEEALQKLEAEREDSSTTANQTETDYKRFIGWAEQYRDASLDVKRMILYHLVRRVTVSRGYHVAVELTITAQQFFGQDAEEPAS